ncbi:SGNH/GDSL hydrolase family protein [Glycomyces salinus]|uniref:SGNH/GDSL hydrolase family protein n=1 Tax=Glycomyces salinus TaxID=980294 RepID=UPI0018ED13C7|nr:SGNH/GDSL hydrolase family protein [Glycomyces salinus]
MSTRKPKASRIGPRVLAVGFLAAVLGAVGAASPASATITLLEYVAIGDSYVSGVGAGDYQDEECYRSDNAYPVQASDEIGEKLWFNACSGATVDDVLADQLDHLTDHTEHVTIGVGGNDAGFSSVLTACAGTDTELCLGAVDGARAYMTDQLPQSLDDLYTQVRDEADRATVVVVGNPRLFGGDTCQGTLAITPEEQGELNAAADLLAETTAAVAADHGFDFVDPRDAFAGHGVCSEDPWILGYTGTLESFHPNEAGQDAYTDLVVPYLKYC